MTDTAAARYRVVYQSEGQWVEGAWHTDQADAHAEQAEPLPDFDAFIHEDRTGTT